MPAVSGGTSHATTKLCCKCIIWHKLCLDDVWLFTCSCWDYVWFVPRNHTLAHVPKSGRLYAFGLGGSGQLGVDSTISRNLPCQVHGPFVPDRQRKVSPVPMKVNDEGSNLVVQRIYTGGDHCFVIYRPADVRRLVCLCVCACVCVCV